jgi:four helix bundle protein
MQEPGVKTERQPAKKFQDLIVWQKVHQFVLVTYRICKDFPPHEVYGLTSQLKRAVISITANIAEGFKRKTKPDKVRFMNISQSSLEECRYYFILANDLNYYDTSGLMPQIEEISKLLDSYISLILVSDS